MIKATIVGNCGRQPELSDTKAGKPMCRFSVASNMKNGKTGETKTSWVNVICFDEMADVVAAKVKAGERLIVSGRLEFDEYEDRNGVKKISPTCIAEDVGVSLRFAPKGQSQDEFAGAF